MRFLLLLLVASPLLAQTTLSGKSKQLPWGGHWWTMRQGEIALGWDDGKGRVSVSKEEALKFDECLSSSTKECKDMMKTLLKANGVSLSPMMKFDLWVKTQIDSYYAAPPMTYYSRATKNELKIHYIDSADHPHAAVAGFAGKCTGWSLSNLDYTEPTKTKTINGVTFTPADIKGILAAVYYGGQFYVPDNMYLGNAYRANGVENDERPEYYSDPAPHILITALEKHIKKEGKIVVADMDPSEGVWNHPLYAYSVKLDKAVGIKVKGTMVLKYAADEVKIDDVFSTNKKRPDLLERELSFELKVNKDWSGKISDAIGSSWTGLAVDNHPDSFLLGLEKGWRKNIYEYKGTEMEKEVNFQLIKKVNLGSGFRVIVDDLLKEYYK